MGAKIISVNQKFKELWVIPIVPGIISGIIVGVPLHRRDATQVQRDCLPLNRA